MAEELELDLSYEGEEGAYAEHEEEIDYAQSDGEKEENEQGNGAGKSLNYHGTNSKSIEGPEASEEVSGDSSREYRRGGDGYSGEHTSLQDDRRGPPCSGNSEGRWKQQHGPHGGQGRGGGGQHRDDRRVRQDRYINGAGNDGYWQGSRAHRSPAGYQAPFRPPPPPPPENGRAPMMLPSMGAEPMMNMYQQQQLLLRQRQQRMAGIPSDAYASNIVHHPLGISQEAPGYSPPRIPSHIDYQYQGPIVNRGYRNRGRGWQSEGPPSLARQPAKQSLEGSHQNDHPVEVTKVKDGKDRISSEGQEASRNLPKMEEDEKQRKLAAIRALREEQAAKNRELAEKRRKKIEEINAAEELRRKRAESIAAAKAAALRKRSEDLQYKRDVLLAQKDAELQILRQKLAEKTRRRDSTSEEAQINESRAKRQKMEEGPANDVGQLEEGEEADLKA